MRAEPEAAALHTLRARLRVPGVQPGAIWQALTNPARMVRWFQQHQSLLGASDGPGQDAMFRGSYHFWSFFTPHAPPDPLHVLLDVRGPQPGDDRLRLHYGWELHGHRSNILLDLASSGNGSLVEVEHRGLPEELPGIGSGRVYWTLVLENMRLYLLGRGGLRFHEQLRAGEMDIATELFAPAGLNATAAAWELLLASAEQGFWLPAGHSAAQTLLREDPHPGGDGALEARLDLEWQNPQISLPGVLSWRLAGREARTRITVVQSGFGGEHDRDYRLGDWRAVLGQMRSQLEFGADWSQIETQEE